VAGEPRIDLRAGSAHTPLVVAGGGGDADVVVTQHACALRSRRRGRRVTTRPLPIASARSRAGRSNSLPGCSASDHAHVRMYVPALEHLRRMAKSSTRPLAQEPMKQWVILCSLSSRAGLTLPGRSLASHLRLQLGQVDLVTAANWRRVGKRRLKRAFARLSR